MEAASVQRTNEERLIELAKQFNNAWNAGDVEQILSCFAPDAVVRIVPPPAPPEPEQFVGHEAIRRWIGRTLSLPFQVKTSNYRVAGSVVTWDAEFPMEGAAAAPDVSEAVFDGDLITDFTP